MSDIFHEIEEEVRRQQYEKLWKRYGPFVIAGALAVIVGTAGYIGWKNYRENQLDRASREFSALIESAQQDPSKATEAIAAFAANAPGGYRALGLFAEAAAIMPRDKIAAQKIYEIIIEEYPDPYLGGLARLKAAMLVSDNAGTDELRARLGPILGDNSVWRYSARELIAYSTFRDGKLEEARQDYDKLRSDLAAPEGIRNRAKQMIAQIDLRRAGITPRAMDAPPDPDLAPDEAAPTGLQPQPQAPISQPQQAPQSPPAPPTQPR